MTDSQYLASIEISEDQNTIECDGVTFVAIGDCDLQAYDVRKYNQISDYQNGTRSGDFCRAVESCDANFNECLIFKNPVESTSG